MKIPLVDLSFSSSAEKKEIFKEIKKIINSNDFILGNDVDVFEKKFAEYIGVRYCIGVASGTDALALSLKALGIGNGDEVIIPAMTFMATASSIVKAEATPVLVDIRSDLPLIDTSKIEQRITKRTKAIMPVHMHGYPCDMIAIRKLAKVYKLFVIEDACQAHGTMYKKKRMGSFGDVAAFSFYPSKNLGACGDAGAVTTSSKHFAEKIKLLRNQGAKEKYKHEIIGYNARLDTLQAAILKTKLKNLNKQNLLRRKNAKVYMGLLKHLPVTMLNERPDMYANYHLFAIQVRKRNKLLAFLESKNIHCGIHYPKPLHLQPALSFLNHKKGDFIHAELFASETLSLPMYPGLTTDKIIYICEQIEKFYKK